MDQLIEALIPTANVAVRIDIAWNATSQSHRPLQRVRIGVAGFGDILEEIVQRLVYSLVNEAARILEDGIASKASDIDMVYLMGYGFPIWRGGPMNYADEVGLFNVVQAMHRFAQNPLDDAKFWQPAPLLDKLAEQGKTFN